MLLTAKVFITQHILHSKHRVRFSLYVPPIGHKMIMSGLHSLTMKTYKKNFIIIFINSIKNIMDGLLSPQQMLCLHCCHLTNVLHWFLLPQRMYCGDGCLVNNSNCYLLKKYIARVVVSSIKMYCVIAVTQTNVLHRLLSAPQM